MRRDWPRHRFRAVVLPALLAGAIALAYTAGSSLAANQTAARTARSLNITAAAHLHLIKPEGSQLEEEGPVTGAIPGSMRAELDTGTTFTGSFTIFTHGGSIRGRGEAAPHGSGRYQSFRGSFIVTSGSGRYAHVKGRAELYGAFDRRTDSVVIQTAGKLTY